MKKKGENDLAFPGRSHVGGVDPHPPARPANPRREPRRSSPLPNTWSQRATFHETLREAPSLSGNEEKKRFKRTTWGDFFFLLSLFSSERCTSFKKGAFIFRKRRHFLVFALTRPFSNNSQDGREGFVRTPGDRGENLSVSKLIERDENGGDMIALRRIHLTVNSEAPPPSLLLEVVKPT